MQVSGRYSVKLVPGLDTNIPRIHVPADDLHAWIAEIHNVGVVSILTTLGY